MMKSDLQTPHVQWHEGMLLSPQHFQQEAGRVDHLVSNQLLRSAPLSWGVASMTLSEGALASQQFEVEAIQAILPDGTLVSWPNGLSRPLRLDLKPLTDRLEQGPVAIYLALASRRGLAEGERLGRFEPLVLPPVEDEVSTAQPLDVPRLALNLQLYAGDKPPSTMTSLQIANLEAEGGLIRVGTFVPPLLQLSAAATLLKRMESLAALMRSRAHFLARLASAPSDPQRTADRQVQLHRLHCLVQGLPLLEQLVQTPESDPLYAYRTLCGLIAPLSELRPAQLPEPPPRYDHANPFACFAALLERLEDSVSEISQDYREVRFESTAEGFRLKLRPEWLEHRLVIGVQGAVLETAADWLETALIGVEDLLPDLRARRVLGLRRHRIAGADELGLKPLPNVAFFEIETSETLHDSESVLIIEPSARLGLSARPSHVVLYAAGLLRSAS